MIFIYNWDMEILFSRILCDIYSPECCKPDRFSEGTRFDTLRRIELKRKKKRKNSFFHQNATVARRRESWTRPVCLLESV